MNKADLVAYLVNLHTLLDAQSKGAGAVPSTTLAAEYEKHWALLKKEIADEARKSNQQHVRTEDGAERPRGEHLQRS